ncbi:MAG: HAD hydrolase family protein [Phycisphaerales bacterium]|nr:HAD hydrolase family protein [Phycisphaerales bacterium]
MPNAETRPENVRLLCLDVDGVLTDGSIFIDANGTEIKRFFVRDGNGLRVWMNLGYEVAVITGRSGPAVQHRMNELGIRHLRAGVKDKGPVFDALLDELGVSAGETAMVGDDLPDLPILHRCGYPVAVHDAAAEVKASACLVTGAMGGKGAVREVVEHLLRARGRWDEAVASFDSPLESR